MAYVYGATRRKQGTVNRKGTYLDKLNEFYREYGDSPDEKVLFVKLGYRSLEEYRKEVKRYNVAGYVKATKFGGSGEEGQGSRYTLHSRIVTDFLFLQARYHTLEELRRILLKELGLRVKLEGLMARLVELELDYLKEPAKSSAGSTVRTGRVGKSGQAQGTAKSDDKSGKPRKSGRKPTIFTVKDDTTLTRLYPYLSNSILRAHFLPNKAESVIIARAKELGVTKVKSGKITQKDFLGLIVAVQQGCKVQDITEIYPKLDPGVIKVLYPYLKKLV